MLMLVFNQMSYAYMIIGHRLSYCGLNIPLIFVPAQCKHSNGLYYSESGRNIALYVELVTTDTNI